MALQADELTDFRSRLRDEEQVALTIASPERLILPTNIPNTYITTIIITTFSFMQIYLK